MRSDYIIMAARKSMMEDQNSFHVISWLTFVDASGLFSTFITIHVDRVMSLQRKWWVLE